MGGDIATAYLHPLRDFEGLQQNAHRSLDSPSRTRSATRAMAEPVSFTASLITVIGLAASVSKVLQQLHKAPDEILVILNEVSDLQVVLNAVRDVGQDSVENEASLRKHVDRAEQQLAQLDNIISRLSKARTVQDSPMVS